MEDYIGSVLLWAGSTIPGNFLLCDGRSLPVSDQNYTALYSVIGNTYGGNQQNFNLPDFRSRVPVGSGNAGPIPVHSGNKGGAFQTALVPANLPAHTHLATVNMNASTVMVGTSQASSAVPTSNLVVATPAYVKGGTIVSTLGFNTTTPDTLLNSSSFNVTTPMQVTNSNTGSGIPVDFMPPFFGMNFIICYNGSYPSPQ
jgi:microcystin-dependent protein